MEWNEKEVEGYFYQETKDFVATKIELRDTRVSYFDTIQCYEIQTDKGISFWVFCGESTLTNIYPIIRDETLDEGYYKHVGFIAEYSSHALNSNF